MVFAVDSQCVGMPHLGERGVGLEQGVVVSHRRVGPARVGGDVEGERIAECKLHPVARLGRVLEELVSKELLYFVDGCNLFYCC